MGNHNFSENEIKSAINTNSVGQIISKLSPDEQKRLAEILIDPQKQRELLSSEQAKKLISFLK